MNSKFELFMRGNKATKKNTFFAATKSLCDKQGNPLEWEIKPLTTKESERIREKYTVEIPVPAKDGFYRQKLSDKYLPALCCAAVVFPDLHNAELQDSYNVTSAEDLLLEMIDNPEEYAAFAKFIQSYSGIETTINDDIAEAKN